MSIETVITSEELHELRAQWAGQKVVLVPTMGALHEGHISLVEKAKALGDRVIVSIFVNPKQFGPREDFATYPRTLAEDVEKLTAAQADAVFLPNASEMYPEGYQTYVVNDVMSLGLCGATRENHFRGVLTVVLKLFNQVKPQAALFGKKDYQQWRLIERMVKDLSLDVAVLGEEIVREKDGLAMSSRNRRLTPEERKVAPQIYKGLEKAHQQYVMGERHRDKLLTTFKQHLAAFKEFNLEYVEVRVQDALQEAEILEKPSVMLVAARLGDVRLIDNIELG